MTQKKEEKHIAKVYVWPFLNEYDFAQVENECIYAGYTAKRRVKVGRVVCWEVSNG